MLDSHVFFQACFHRKGTSAMTVLIHPRTMTEHGSLLCMLHSMPQAQPPAMAMAMSSFGDSRPREDDFAQGMCDTPPFEVVASTLSHWDQILLGEPPSKRAKTLVPEEEFTLTHGGLVTLRINCVKADKFNLNGQTLSVSVDVKQTVRISLVLITFQYGSLCYVADWGCQVRDRKAIEYARR